MRPQIDESQVMAVRDRLFGDLCTVAVFAKAIGKTERTVNNYVVRGMPRSMWAALLWLTRHGRWPGFLRKEATKKSLAAAGVQKTHDRWRRWRCARRQRFETLCRRRARVDVPYENAVGAGKDAEGKDGRKVHKFRGWYPSFWRLCTCQGRSGARLFYV